MRWRSSGHVHFVINGVDQGVAATDVPAGVYAVVDLYGRSARVSIVPQLTQQASVEEVSRYMVLWCFVFYCFVSYFITLQEQASEEPCVSWNDKERLQWYQRPLCFAATDSVAFFTDLRTATFVLVESS